MIVSCAQQPCALGLAYRLAWEFRVGSYLSKMYALTSH